MGRSRRPSRPKILAVSSGGGHWVQLLRLKPAFVGCEIAFVTVDRGYQADVPEDTLHTVPDASRHTKIRLFRTAFSVLKILLRERPDVIISTGAAPGFLALFIGKKIGVKTIWVDSLANADELSISGRQVRPYADLWLTQWPHLAADDGPRFMGSVL